ncbi:trigger factor [Roseomonas sp. JC162]|uniref:Trigger factor n=1 Tax=Neoroseomonas marina TaxID=1232220 RepID=A0A848EBE2_9PROT|nr:trigger factor [Neoroseomonas marina]NMJ40585.1 trigger factor [Neoroseomonas marina]
MDVTETERDGLRRAYDVVIPAEEITSRRDARLGEIARTVSMPGFRPGRVPIAAVKDRYGAAVLAEVIEAQVKAASARVVADHGLRPAQDPRIEIRRFAEDGDLAFHMELEVLPEVTLPDFGAIRLERLVVEPTPEAVERALLEVAERHGHLVEVEPRPAARGEVLVCDVTGHLPADLLQNGPALGALAGQPGAAPSKWGLDVSPGLERAIVIAGTNGTLPFFDMLVRGTARKGGFIRVFPGAAAGVPAAPGQVLTLCLQAEIASGALPEGAAVRLGFNERAANAILKSSRVPVEPGPAEMRATITLTDDRALTVVRPLLEISLPNEGAVNLVLRVGPARLFAGDREPEVPPFDGGTLRDVAIEIGGAGPVPGLSGLLDGMAPGETREMDVVYPADHAAAELAGRRARFVVTARALRVRQRRAVDDDLAGAVGAGDLGALREQVRQGLQRDYDRRSRQVLKRAVLDALAQQADFAVPQGLVDLEFAEVWQRFQAERHSGRVGIAEATTPEDALRARYRALAERRVRLRLLLAEIGRAHDVQLPSEEVAHAIRREANRYPGQEEQVIEFYRRTPSATEALRAPLLEERIIDFVAGRSTVVERRVSAAEAQTAA